MQKVTKFEGILITKVYFSNKNIYGNLMLTAGRQVNRSNNLEMSMSDGITYDDYDH